MVIKICEIRPKRWGRLWVERTYGKGKFWVWSGTEMQWCIVKVVMIMMMMMNWWKKYLKSRVFQTEQFLPTFSWYKWPLLLILFSSDLFQLASYICHWNLFSPLRPLETVPYFHLCYHLCFSNFINTQTYVHIWHWSLTLKNQSDMLFTDVLNNDQHVLFYIWPDHNNHMYNLRPRQHELTLEIKGDARNFFERQLFKDTY